jgi:peroxiredoxin
MAMLALLLTACNAPTKKAPETKVIEQPKINDLPGVIVIEESGKQFLAKELPGNSILIFFGATCDHCQREARAIHDHLTGFSAYQLYFISMDSFQVIHDFAKEYGIANQSNIHFLRADGASVSQVLGYLQTPAIFIYKGYRITKRFDGETKVDDILKVL